MIDKTGKIVFKGHPASRPDLEADFDTLLKGEAIEDEGGKGKELDSAVVAQEIVDFKLKCKGFQEDKDLKEAAKSVPQGFCVITCEAKFNPKNGKTHYDYTNHRIVMGKEDSVNKFKEAFKDLKGSWEVKEQMQAM